MYQYDHHDQRLVDERVAQFRDQTRRFLAGRALRGRVSAVAPAERPLHTEIRADAARARFRTVCCRRRQLRKLAHIGRKYDRGYGHFTTRQNIQFNWPRLEDVPDILARARDRANARDPDQRQLRAQHHQRSFRRHRSGRDRRPASVQRAGPAMGVVPSGVCLPAAQIQDRDFGLGDRSRGDLGPRHRHARAVATTPEKSGFASSSAEVSAARRSSAM